MNNKPAFFDFHRDKDSVNQTSEETDFTEVVCCVLPDKTEEAKNRKIKADQVREFIAAKKIDHSLLDKKS